MSKLAIEYNRFDIIPGAWVLVDKKKSCRDGLIVLCSRAYAARPQWAVFEMNAKGEIFSGTHYDTLLQAIGEFGLRT